MKKIFLTFAILSGITAFSQNVGINATGAAPVTSAALDVDMANKGVLIPRVALTTNNAFAPVTGTATVSLLVYNSATAGIAPNNVTPGYYYWDGSIWQRLYSGATADNWKVGTSAATTNTLTGTGFFGTTNANHVDFVTNGVFRGRLLSTGQTNFGAATTALTGGTFSVVGTASLPRPITAYTSFGESAILGARLAGATLTFGTLQGEENSGTLNASGVAGIAYTNNQRGVIGQKPVGGSGFGGLFLNDLGYSGGFFNLSDQRVKTDIKPIEKALEKVLRLQGKTYRYAAPYDKYLGGDQLTFGFIAQELEVEFPEMVAEKSFTPPQTKLGENDNLEINFKAVSTITLIPVLVEAIKEQQVMIEEQRTMMLEMKKEIEELKKKVGQ